MNRPNHKSMTSTFSKAKLLDLLQSTHQLDISEDEWEDSNSSFELSYSAESKLKSRCYSASLESQVKSLISNQYQEFNKVPNLQIESAEGKLKQQLDKLRAERKCKSEQLQRLLNQFSAQRKSAEMIYSLPSRMEENFELETEVRKCSESLYVTHRNSLETDNLIYQHIADRTYVSLTSVKAKVSELKYEVEVLRKKQTEGESLLRDFESERTLIEEHMKFLSENGALFSAEMRKKLKDK